VESNQVARAISTLGVSLFVAGPALLDVTSSVSSDRFFKVNMDITRPVLVSELPEETVIEFTLVEKKFNHLSKQYTAGALF
jgi:hypothetical protein